MKGLLLIGIFMFYSISSVWGQDVIKQYAGTAMLYPVQEDSFHLSTSDMVPFYINHLGRHGARFPTSGKALDKAKKALILGQQENRLTTDGKILLSTLQHLSDSFEGQWGKLSVLGELEQKGIAGRMMRHYPQLFSNSVKVEAIATYVPRCINSMDAFLTRLMQDNKSYVNYKNNGDWLSIYEAFVRNKISSASIMKKFFIEPERETDEEAEEVVMALFSIAAILPDTGLLTNLDDLFTMEEWRSYWQTQNLRQYMSKSSAPVGRMLPVAISWPLLSDFIYTTDEVIKGKSDNAANFRFAHAETVIPFVALMGIENTDVQISNPDSVSRYWKDYEISPMAANVQWIFYHDKARGVWVKILLNEKEAKLPIATSRFHYYPWETVCAYFKERIEMAKRILVKN